MNPDNATPYEFVGEMPALGHLQLTQLAQSYEQLDSADLAMFFPALNTPERTVVIETVTEGLGLAPIVRPGQPSGAFLEPERIQRRTVEPAVIREDDFVDQFFINQLRRIGTFNEAYSATEIIARRVQRLVNRQQRTLSLLQACVLRGGINYTDPRTNVSITVPTYIPQHNLFKYDGYDQVVAVNGTINANAGPLTAYKALAPTKGRPEALYFQNPATNQVAVPWTHPNCDILRCLRYLKHYLYNTNKNHFEYLVMSRDLYTVLHENQFIKQHLGQVGIALGTNNISSAAGLVRPGNLGVSSNGEITHLAGLQILLVDSLYRDPNTKEVKKMWPSNQVAIVASRHFKNSSETLGRTHYPVAESPTQSAGLWMRSNYEPSIPAPPGASMQLGNAFLPFAMYPQWISLVEVCDETAVDMNLVLRADAAYGTF